MHFFFCSNASILDTFAILCLVYYFIQISIRKDNIYLKLKNMRLGTLNTIHLNKLSIKYYLNPNLNKNRRIRAKKKKKKKYA